MSSIQQNSHSMLGVNTLETDEITFSDGTTITTNNFATASDLITYTAGSNIAISAGNEISSTDTDTTYTAGDGIDITGTTIKAEYIKPQLRIISFDKDDVLNLNNLETRWGNGSVHVVQTSNRQIGDSFCSGTQYEQTLTQNGYYRIRAHSNAQSDGYNDRVSFMIYLRINSTDYETQNKNFFSWTYIRNNSDAAHGNNSFEDYIYLTSGTTIQVRHKLETGTNRNFDNTLTNTQMDVYLNLTIERVEMAAPIPSIRFRKAY